MEENCKSYLKTIALCKGQLEGISKMIDSKRDSQEIVTQISAVKASLTKLSMEILKAESSECFEIKNKKERKKKIDNLINTVFKFS